MKTDAFYRTLRLVALLLIGSLVIACGEDNPVNPDPPGPENKEDNDSALDKYKEGKEYFASGDNQDYKKALDLFLESAKAGCDSAQVAVAYMCEYGLGTDQDMTQAKAFYEEAANQGHKVAIDKVKTLRRSTSRLVLPSEYTESVKDLLVWNDDTVRVVNGDCSFYCSDSKVFVTDKSGNPVYLSFRSPVGVIDSTPLVMDAQETAVSLLLSSLPYIFDCESEAFYQNARECIRTYPETQQLAASIEASVKKNGHMVAEDIKVAAKNASEVFFKRIGLSLTDGETNLASVNPVNSPSGVTRHTYYPNRAQITTRASGDFGEKPEVVHIGTSERLFWMEITSDEPYYNESKERMEWKGKVYNYLPIYFAAIPVRYHNLGNGKDFDVKTLATEYMVRPFNITDIYEDIGIKGPAKWLNGIKENYGDLVNSIKAYRYYKEHGVVPDDYHGRKMDYESAKVSLPINDDYDGLFITSADVNSAVVSYAIIDVIIFPVLKACLKQLKNLDEDSQAEFYLTILKFIDEKTLNQLEVCIRNDDTDLFKDIIIDRTKKLLEVTRDYVLQNWDKAWIKMDPTEVLDNAVAELKVIKESLEFVELFGNMVLWAGWQFSTDSFPIFFNVNSDAPPADLVPVDLGLSVYWANCNVGATAPRGYGRYYAWGETKHKDEYSWLNYHSPDRDDILSPEYDVATVLWGPKWRMPTADEISELAACQWEAETSVFPFGMRVTSHSTGNSIFFLTGGAKGEDDTSRPREFWGQYWTSTVSNDWPLDAAVLDLCVSKEFSGYQLSTTERYVGMTVRPVADIARLAVSDDDLEFGVVPVGSNTKHRITIENKGMGTMELSFEPIDGPFMIDKAFRTTYQLASDESMPLEITFSPPSVLGAKYGAILYIKTNDKHTPVHYITLTGWADRSETHSGPIDLGLSVSWASCNVGASSQEEYGYYVSWGELEEDSAYIWNNYKYCNGSQTNITKYYSGDGKIELDSEDDIAQKQSGGKWRMPTETEFKELIDKCDWSGIVKLNGVDGRFVYNRKDYFQYIFLPMSGYKFNQSVSDLGQVGLYWTSTLWKQDPRYACSAKLEPGSQYVNGTSRAYGLNVRAVYSGSGSTSSGGGLDDIPGHNL